MQIDSTIVLSTIIGIAIYKVTINTAIYILEKVLLMLIDSEIKKADKAGME